MAFESLYDNLIAEYYDASPIVAGRVDAAFYVDAAEEFGGPVLELGCGSGRVTLAIAGAGLEITGLDLSRDMLARAEQKLETVPEETRSRVTLAQGNMTNFDLPALLPQKSTLKFRLAIIPFRPFQHLLDAQQQLNCLACIHRHLEPGGRLILDFFQTDPRRMHDPEFLEERVAAEYEMSGGRKVVLTEHVTAFHRAEQRNDVEMIYNVTHADGHTERVVMAFPFRYFFRYEVEHLLARGGFEVEQTFGDFDGTALKDDSKEMIFVARAV